MIAQFEKRRVRQVSPSTVANELTVLKAMLNLGRRWGYLDVVPVIDRPKKARGRERYLDVAEIQRLLTACQGSRNPYLFALVTVALNTGAPERGAARAHVGTDRTRGRLWPECPAHAV
jgi:integrase